MGKNGSSCLARIGKRAPAFTASFVKDSHVVEGPRHVGMARAERLLADDQRALIEPLRLAVLTLVSKHICEVGERSSHEGMARAKRFFSDRQRPLEEIFRLPILALVSIQVRQVVQAL